MMRPTDEELNDVTGDDIAETKAALKSFLGRDPSEFKEDDLRRLAWGRYFIPASFTSAREATLQQLGLRPGPIDAIVTQKEAKASAAGKSSTGGGSGAADKRFKATDATGPDHIYVETAEETEVVDLVLAKKGYQVLCSGRQTGKSTLARAVQRNLSARSITVVYVELTPMILHFKSNTVHEVWPYMFSLLASQHGGERFDLDKMRQLLGRPSAQPDAGTFEALCNQEPPLCIIVDEASTLGMADTAVADELLQAVRKLKNNPGIGCRGVILVGVHSVLNLLYTHNRPVNSSMGGDAGTGAVGFKRSASASRSRTSPFRQDALTGVSNFSPQQVRQLMQQLQQQLAGRAGPITVSNSWVEDAANTIHAITNGNRGLVGLCGRAVEDDIIAAGEDSQPLSNWDGYVRYSLPKMVAKAAAYWRFTKALKDVYPDARHTSPLVPDELQLEQSALQDALMHEFVEVDPDKLPYMLLEEGVLVPVDSKGQPSSSAAQLTFGSDDGDGRPHSSSSSGSSSSSSSRVRLALAAPLVACSLLAELILQSSSSELLPRENELPSSLSLDWLLDAVVMHMSMDTVFAEQARNRTSGKPSEYAYQGQFVVLTNSILKALSVHRREVFNYKVVTEARNLQVEGESRRRLAILLTASLMPALGFELVSCASKQAMVDHVQRAGQLYHSLHACDVYDQQAGQVQKQGCEVLVVNFEVAGDDQAVPKMHFPPCGSGVRVRNVVLPKLGHGDQAWIYASPDQCRTVTLHHPSSSGSLRLCRRRS